MFSGVMILMKGKLESRAMEAASAVFPHPESPVRERERDYVAALLRASAFARFAKLCAQHAEHYGIRVAPREARANGIIQHRSPDT